MVDMSTGAISLKLFLAALLSGIIGLERETHGRAAGLRTHILVSVGSCLIMLTSMYVSEVYKEIGSFDPGRIASGVVTGIGFLGAGTILRYRVSVIGLTTAASIWTVAAIGLGIGVGFYEGTLVATLIVLLTLFLVGKFEYGIIRKDWYKTLVVQSEIDANLLHKVRAILTDYRAEIKDLEVEKVADKAESKLRFDIKLTSSKYDDNIIIDMLKLERVSKAYWE